MSLKLLLYALERAVMTYADTLAPAALTRAREHLAHMRAGLDHVEILLAELEAGPPKKQEVGHAE
jgi:hypothetical protein